MYLRDGLRAAVDARFLSVVDDGTVTFRHALLADAVNRTLLPDERRSLHRRVAEEVERHPAGMGSLSSGSRAAHLAYHWRCAGEPVAAVRHALVAANDATARHAPAATLEHLLTVLDLWDTVEDPARLAGSDRLAIELRTSEAASFAGERDTAIALAQAAVDRAGDDPERRAEALGRLAYGHYTAGRLTKAHEIAAMAVAAIDGRAPSRAAVDALLLWAGTALTLGLFEKILSRAAEIRAVIDDAVGDPDFGPRLDHLEGTALAGVGDFRGIALLDRAIDGGLATGQAFRVALSIFNRAEVLRGMFGPATVLASTQEAFRRLQSLGVPDTFLAVQSSIAELLLRLGRLKDLDELFDRVPIAGQFMAAYGFALVKAALALERGVNGG